VSLIRRTLRRLLGLLAQKDGTMKAAVEGALSRQDYHRVGKPAIDWDDEAARTHLVDELVNDALAALGTWATAVRRPMPTEPESRSTDRREQSSSGGHLQTPAAAREPGSRNPAARRQESRGQISMPAPRGMSY
jgi:hypothetical protein